MKKEREVMDPEAVDRYMGELRCWGGACFGCCDIGRLL